MPDVVHEETDSKSAVKKFISFPKIKNGKIPISMTNTHVSIVQRIVSFCLKIGDFFMKYFFKKIINIANKNVELKSEKNTFSLPSFE